MAVKLFLEVRREAFCFSIVPDDCGEPPTTRRVCQCVIEAAVSSSTPPESAAADEASVLLLWAVLLGSLGLCCVCLCCVCRRKAKVQVEEREERLGGRRLSRPEEIGIKWNQ